ncbi:uncharacterized protein BO97DRAFT_424292 [Aspergillus homomorphus CBS 101889]|uniref:Calcium-dependent phosphotriesterase n=1 Tax=Aspergillus homomorphus (strain CBS 101889) TaxID=1450537 RepID=A0A395HXY4_ASPHC|nr:hypothetical protein BO97DRAFT_424292 [Aspergillus homomorphus CBS 101889]RAL12657.1 hypothetical protein BO97DRAFT_424292 [Aspergillus homomorphus CBS 101889]
MNLLTLTLWAALSPRTTVAATLRTTFQYTQNGTWLENLALRPSGLILVTRMDVPELWTVDPATGQETLVSTFPKRPLGKLVITDIGHPVVGTWGVYEVDLSSHSSSALLSSGEGGSASVRKIATLGEAGWLNGMARLPGPGDTDRAVVLIADSVNRVIWQLDARTGAYGVALNDAASMAASPTDPLGLGVNGVRVWREYVYWSTNSRSAVFRVPVRWDQGRAKVVQTGAVETVVSGVVVDDFAVPADGMLYLMAVAENEVVRVAPDGNHSVLAGTKDSLDVAGCTSGVVSGDGRKLFVTTCGGHIVPPKGRVEPAKVVEITLA